MPVTERWISMTTSLALLLVAPRPGAGQRLAPPLPPAVVPLFNSPSAPRVRFVPSEDPRPRSYWLEGGLVGLGVGLAGMLWLGAMCESGAPCSEGTGFYGVLVPALGFGAGALIGSQIHKSLETPEEDAAP